MAAFVLTIQDPLGVTESLESGIDGVDDWRAFWFRVRPAWAKSRERMFDTLGRSSGSPWVPYQRRERQYVAIKGRDYGRQITNQDLLTYIRGARPRNLKFSLTEIQSPFFVFRASEQSCALGTSVAYASTHERGGHRAPAAFGGYIVPQRRILSLGDFTQDVANLLGDYAGEVAAGLVDGGRFSIRSADVAGLL